MKVNNATPLQTCGHKLYLRRFINNQMVTFEIRDEAYGCSVVVDWFTEDGFPQREEESRFSDFEEAFSFMKDWRLPG